MRTLVAVVVFSVSLCGCVPLINRPSPDAFRRHVSLVNLSNVALEIGTRPGSDVTVQPGETQEIAITPLEQKEIVLVAKRADGEARTYRVPVMSIDSAEDTNGVSFSRLHNHQWLLLHADGTIFLATVGNDGTPRLVPERAIQPLGFPVTPVQQK
jgi:hypothetical protein